MLTITTLTEASQAIIQGDSREAILAKLMQVIANHTPAQRILLLKAAPLGWQIAAMAMAPQPIEVVLDAGIATAKTVPLSVLEQGSQTQQDVYLARASFAEVDDSYLASLNSRASLFCAPLQRKGVMVGLLYLELDELADELASGSSSSLAWNADQAAGVKFLAIQALETIEQLQSEVEITCAALDASPQLNGVENQPDELLPPDREICFRAVTNSVPVLMWISGTDLVRHFFNQPWLEFTGRSLEQESHHGWIEGIHPEDRDRCWHTYQTARQNQERFEVEYRLRRTDGEYRWVLDIGSPRYINQDRLQSEFQSKAQGNPLGYIGVCIDITERKQTEFALQASEMRYWEIVESQTDLVCRFLPDGTLTFVNDAYCDYFGKSRQELIGKTFLSWISVEAQAIFQANMDSLSPFHRMVTAENQVTLANGEIRWQHWVDQAIYDAEGNLLELQGVGRDITERKLAEENLSRSEARNRAIVEAMPDLMLRVCRDGSCTDAIYSGSRAHQYVQVTHHLADVLPPNLLAQQLHYIAQALDTGELQVYEHALEKWGKLAYEEVRISRLSADEVLVLVRDVSDRKMAEIALQKSEEKFRHITNTVPGAVYQYYLNVDGVQGFSFMSRGAVDLYELTSEQLVEDAQLAWNMVFPEDLLPLVKSIRKSADQMEPWEAEYRICTPSGHIKWLAGESVPSRQPDGRIVWNGFMMDITDRKRMEEALRNSELRLRQITDAIPGVVYQYHLSSQGEESFPWISQGLQQLYGLAPEDVQRDPTLMWKDMIPEDVEMMRQSIVQSMNTLSIWQAVYRLLLPDGTYKWISGKSIPTALPDGSVLWNGVLVDISSLKQVEAALQESEKRYMLATCAAKVGVWDWNFETGEFYIDPNLKAILGYEDIEIPNDINAWARYIHPDDRLRLREMTQESSHGNIIEYTCEYRMMHRDGSVRWILVRGNVIHDELGIPLRMVGTDTDISDRKQLEEAIHQTNVEMQAILDAFPDLFFRMSQDSTILDYKAGSSLEQLYISPQEFLGKPMCAILPCEVGEQMYQAIQQALANNRIVSLEYALPINHTVHHYEARIVPIQPDQVVATVRNINDRKRAEAALQQLNQELEQRVIQRTEELIKSQAALQESEQFLRSLYEGVDYSIFVIDVLEDGSFLHAGWNPACEQAIGKASHQVQGKRLQAILPSVEAARTEAFFTRCLKTGSAIAQEDHRQFQGQTFWYLTTLNPLKDSTGRIYRLVGTEFNITDLKQTEAALQESQQFVQRIADSTPNLLYIYDFASEKNVYSNRELLSVLGYTSEILQTVDGKITNTLLHPEDLSRFSQHIQHLKTAQDGEIHEIEYRMRHADQSWRWLCSRDTVFKRDVTGQVIQYLSTAQDITDRKQLEQEQSRLLTILEASSDYIGISTVHGDILWLNAQMKRLFNLETNASISHLKITDFYPDWAAEIILNQGIPTTAILGTWLGETAIRDQTGQEIPVSQLILKHGSDADAEYFSTIMRDISDRKRSEIALQQANTELESRVELRTAELRQAKEAAEAANLAKSTFLVTMSHELRTPLNAILGFSQLMARDSHLNLDQQQQLSIINRNGEHLLTLINDILEMSKIEAGRTTLNSTTFNLYQLLQNIEEMFWLKADAKGLSLRFYRSETVPQFVRADEGKLRQVLINLISNAIKFTTSGEITLRVYLQTTPDSPQLSSISSSPQLYPECLSATVNSAQPDVLALWFEVQDTGLGISSEELDLLFKPFVQTETGRKSQEGTGLGLPISHQFVHLMGGELTVESTLDSGSIFRFNISVQPLQGLSIQPQQPNRCVVGLAPDQPSYRILVVEDNWANQQLLVDFLELLGFQVQIAQNGQEAIQLWRDWQPDLIWMDIRMPAMDGYEATRQIRAEIASRSLPIHSSNPLNSKPSEPIIIALTASAFEEDRVAILSAGCDDFVRKPVSESTLLEKMAQYLGVQYIYENHDHFHGAPSPTLVARSASKPGQPELDLTLGNLVIMPSEWIAQLNRAAQIADEELLLQLIEQIPSGQDELTSFLRNLVHNFCLEEIIELTRTPESSSESSV